MPSLSGLSLATHMVASIAGANPPTITRSRGLASIARTGTGVYTMTMSEAIDLAGGDGVVTALVNSATVDADVCVSVTSATVLTVTLAVAAVATELSYWIKVEAIGPN